MSVGGDGHPMGAWRMFIIVGWIVVIVCVIGGYMAMGGKLAPL